jgi:hypothetical protein
LGRGAEPRFRALAPGTWGDLGHDALPGPGRDDWNLALFKSFLISEVRSRRLEVRAESFNTWKHTQCEGNVQKGGISTNLGQQLRGGDFGVRPESVRVWSQVAFLDGASSAPLFSRERG